MTLKLKIRNVKSGFTLQSYIFTEKYILQIFNLEILSDSIFPWKVNQTLEKWLWRIHRKTPLSEVFLNKIAGLRPATLLKKRFWHRYFPVNFTRFLRTPFFTEHLWWLLMNPFSKVTGWSWNNYFELFWKITLKKFSFSKFAGWIWRKHSEMFRKISVSSLLVKALLQNYLSRILLRFSQVCYLFLRFVRHLF